MNVMPPCCLTNCLIFSPVWVLVLVYLSKLYCSGVCAQSIHCIKNLIWTICSFICCFVIFCYLWFIRGGRCVVFCGLLFRFLNVHPKAILKWSMVREKSGNFDFNFLWQPWSLTKMWENLIFWQSFISYLSPP